MTPQYFSIGHFLKELFLAERTELSTRNVNAAYFHLIDVELLHYPHGPVNHLVSCPEQRICGGGDKRHTITTTLVSHDMKNWFSHKSVF